MYEEEQKLAEESRKWIKKNYKQLITAFADPFVFHSTENPISVFMAGSPGAGKTEFSKQILVLFEKRMVRIDPDEIRGFLPGYNGKNSYVMQSACALGVEKILDVCFNQHQDFLLDGMMADFNKAKNNIERCLKAGRDVFIFYVYQDPKIAWDFTQKREELEKRNIPVDAFIFGFVQARCNVTRLKEFFGDKIHVNVILKDYENNEEKLGLMWIKLTSIFRPLIMRLN